MKDSCLLSSIQDIQRSPGSLHKGTLKGYNTGSVSAVSEKQTFENLCLKKEKAGTLP